MDNLVTRVLRKRDHVQTYRLVAQIAFGEIGQTGAAAAASAMEGSGRVGVG